MMSNKDILIKNSVQNVRSSIVLHICSLYADDFTHCYSIENPFQVPISVTVCKNWNDFTVPNDYTENDFYVFISDGYRLTREALAEIYCCIAKNPEADIIYGDEKCFSPSHETTFFLKPGWSPELLLSFQYIGGAFAIKAFLVKCVMANTSMATTAVLYDFLLRCAETNPHVIHLPIIFSEYNVVCKNTLQYRIDAARVIEQALARRGSQGKAIYLGTQPNGEPAFQLSFPHQGPQVAILIANRNRPDLLDACIESIEKITAYENYTIYVVDNESDSPDMLDWLKKCKHPVIHVERPAGKFNFSHVYNQASTHISEPLMLLLNNDTVVRSRHWLSDMVGYACLPDVGSVGARLIFENGQLQHCGIRHNVKHGFPGTVFRHMSATEDGYWYFSRLGGNHMALTAACLLTWKSDFISIGGLDAVAFAVAFNDCDYGYRLHQAGKRNVFCPTAELTHYENATRGAGDSPHEEAAYIRKYGKIPDAYHNSNIQQDSLTYAPSSRVAITLSPPPFRLVMVMHDLTRTGACRNACFLATELLKRGNMTPIVLSHLDGPLRPLLEAEGIEVHILPHFNLLGAIDEAQMHCHLETMTSWLADLRPDVVYGNTMLTFWAMAAAAKLHLPSLWNIRESETPFSHLDEHAPPVTPFAQSCMAYPYEVIFVADATKSLFVPWHKNYNAITIHNGFDREYFEQQCSYTREEARACLGFTADTIYCVVVGTVCDRKGQADILEAFIRLAPDTHNAVLGIVCGTIYTPYRRALEARWEALPDTMRHRIKFYSDAGAIEYHYKAADIFICTSRIESFPRVIQEAMACHLPIITTPVFGVVEQVRDTISALFYAPGDVEHLSQHLKSLIVDHELRESLGAMAGVALDILPDTATMIEQYERIFQEAWVYGKPRIPFQHKHQLAGA